MTSRQRLFALEAFGIKLGLENMRTLVAALGHPEQAYPTIHIAGTNGKGSVSAMVERALRASGRRTGLYTSPHLDRIEERMAIDGVPVDPAAFDGVATEVFAVVDAAQADGRLAVTPTFFEVTTAIAFELFRRAAVEVAVIEVGLGGRFDATNVITPIVGAITSIAFDHERHLGHTLSAIAFEKAGIAKRGVPLVVGELPDEALATIAARAAEAGAPLRRSSDAELAVAIERGVVSVRGGAARLPLTRLALVGRHQAANAATALGVLHACGEAGLPVTPAAMARGLAEARWPARLEWLHLDAGQLLLDAAHNPAGAAALASYLSDAAIPPLPMALVTMQDKNLEGMVGPLLPHVSRWLATTVPMPRAYSADALAGRLRSLVGDTPVEVVADADEAVRRAMGIERRALAAGSIYFVGPLRARLLASGAVPI